MLEDTYDWCYNFAHNAYEMHQGFPQNSDELREYLPQYEAAQGLFDLYLAMGDNPLVAFEKVLEVVVAAHE